MTVDVPHPFQLTSVTITEAVRMARMGGRRRFKLGENSFKWLCEKFQEAEKFKAFGRATQILWARELKFACRDDTLGTLPTSALDPALIQGYLDGWSDKPGKQAVALSAFKALEKWAAVRKHLNPHQLTYGVETGKPEGGHTPWADEQVALAETYARPDLARAITLGAHTGQRGSDLIRMGWGDIETFQGRDGINVKTVKTGREIWVPILPQLAKAMSAWERRPGPFLLDQWGMPWQRQGLTNAWWYERQWNEALRPLKDAGLVLHGLRAHACVRYFRAGLNPKQIATLVGMSTPMVERYTRLSQQKIDAVAAVIQLENFAGTNRRKAESSE